MEYQEFLKQKVFDTPASGFEVDRESLNPKLFEFEKDIVLWSLKLGKAAVFADCGLGKTIIQLEWSRHIIDHTSQPVLILAPLAVSHQTKREGDKFNIPVKICKDQDDVQPGINITNYERLDRFNPSEFTGIVLDESSILKSYMGKTKLFIIESFTNTPYKLACTATPSPNDHMEILNHSAFLDVMKSHEALAIWFLNDTSNMGTYRLKQHCIKDFWKWVSSWAVSLSKPSDFGYNDEGFILPDLNILEHTISVDPTINAKEGMLFRIPDMNATAFHKEKRLTAPARAEMVAKIRSERPNDCFMVWCDTNYEADELKKVLPNAIEARGSDKPERKEQVAIDFIDGKIETLISKPKIFGFGLNFQHCHNVIFCGLNYSYESFYQASRRFWRFGQTKPVNIHTVLGDTEKNIIDTIKRKEKAFNELKTNMQTAMAEHQNLAKGRVYRMEFEKDVSRGKSWELHLGDAVEGIKEISDNSIDLMVFSPPFSNLYIYSDSYRDMGNTKNDKEFFENFEFLIPELYRILRPGRVCVIHCKDLVNYKGRDGFAGLRDFPGDTLRLFQKHQFIYHSRVTIWKDPVIEMQRTKCQGLLHKQVSKDSTFSRQGLADYLIVMRKWAESENNDVRAVSINEPQTRFEYYVGDKPPETIQSDDPRYYSINVWQRYASPVWFDIRQTNVLNVREARDNSDEKHICPLQLDVIERSIHLWSNPGETVYSPFAGIGSEGYGAVSLGRKFIGHELKRSYFDSAIRNLTELEAKDQLNLFAEQHG